MFSYFLQNVPPEKAAGEKGEAVNLCCMSCSEVMALCSIPPMSGVGRFVPPPDSCPIFSEAAASCPEQLLAGVGRITGGSNKH